MAWQFPEELPLKTAAALQLPWLPQMVVQLCPDVPKYQHAPNRYAPPLPQAAAGVTERNRCAAVMLALEFPPTNSAEKIKR
jgi:hypothetical protein